MKNQRLFQMLNLIINRKQVTASELAKKFNVSVRTIYRDVETLSLSGIPIYTTAGKNGGIKILENYKIEKMFFTDDEQDMVLQVVQNIQIPSEKLDDLEVKLSSLFNKKNEKWLTVDFTKWGKEAKDENKKFDLLKKADLKRIVLKIEYCSEASNIKEREICPIQLIYKATSWYLYAFCLSRHDYRLFKLNRIIKIIECEEIFDEKIIYTWNGNYQINEARSIDICLKFDKKVGYRVYDEFSFECIKEDKNGDFIVNVKMPPGDWIYGYILSFGANVKVLKPQYIKDKVIETASSILQG